MSKSVLDQSLSAREILDAGITKEQADRLFDYFKRAPLFKWQPAQNDCEDRANAVCILLDSWNITNYKAWVFSGSFLNNNNGNLRNLWKFHVAPLLSINEEGRRQYYVIDPATLGRLDTLDAWAEHVTEDHGSTHLITNSNYYIFTPGKFHEDDWFKRNRQNYKWTIQGLAGINGVSSTGKAQLCFCKPRIANTEQRFRQLMHEKPAFLSPS